jgi:hypothetical protein
MSMTIKEGQKRTDRETNDGKYDSQVCTKRLSGSWINMVSDFNSKV